MLKRSFFKKQPSLQSLHGFLTKKLQKIPKKMVKKLVEIQYFWKTHSLKSRFYNIKIVRQVLLLSKIGVSLISGSLKSGFYCTWIEVALKNCLPVLSSDSLFCI